ncbi:uncharacterized protein BDZ99DRAFT_468373 [Mytilinidion resinicola]|uniref:Mid2 domain-containing protein n=1 Tax=Mytilinidion resinicola TaxID=574789 RepID=A0A6A6Y4H8_9PEZI|nr:uncharacterized protein BDZ99DRAFT_468373 [Mytilinidion resinicola]KAF2803423.1 hypothetical protein BDZ99DRAFT_468373 [Mytilinidion resinicola]
MATNSSVCYFPNHVTNGDDISNIKFVPCDPAASVSACCVAGESCTGSGLCYSDSGAVYRGGCTDRNWGDACPQYCSEDGTGMQAGSQDSFQFLSNCVGTTFVCGNINGCANSNLTFPHTIGPIMQVNITGNFSRSQDISLIPSSCPTAPPSTSPSEICAPKWRDSHSTRTVGVALGVTLGVLLLSAIAWALWERRGRTRLMKRNVGAGAEFASANEYVYKQTPLVEVEDHRQVLEMPGR